MVGRFRPLDVKLDFQDRVYKLGETITLGVELNARGDVSLREGRVDLMCEERWSENSTIMVPEKRRYVAADLRIGLLAPINLKTQKSVTIDYKETHLHSTVVFVQEDRINSDTNYYYGPRLKIESKLPPHAATATLQWSLVVIVSLAGGRDIRTQQPVKVSLAPRR